MVYSVRIAQIEPVVGLEARAVGRAVHRDITISGIERVFLGADYRIVRHRRIILELAAQLVSVVPVAQHQLKGVLLLVVRVDECIAPGVANLVCGYAVVSRCGWQAGFVLGLRICIVGPAEEAVLVLAKILFDQRLEAIGLHLAARKSLEEFSLACDMRVRLRQVPVIVIEAFQLYRPHADGLLDARHAVQGLLRP
ncbi:MAG: hypothetical protein BWY96_03147 [Spirochaetes bacterium ADurb.BinA120]|nr:MAG: hypothetical protein BWY96_03147 [Spirochaetes bacterium ADurb.BinA120]